MTEPTPEGQLTLIPASKSAAILELLVNITAGPKEAYGTLVTALWRFNFELMDDPATTEAFIAEIATSLRSMEYIPTSKQ